MIRNREYKIGTVFLILLTIQYSMLLYGPLQNLYNSYALYINIVFILTGFFIYGEIKISYLFFLILLMLCMTLSLFYTHGGLGSVATSVASFAVLLLMKEIRFSNKQKNYYKYLNIVLLLYLFLFSFLGADNYNFYIEQKYNPNGLGFFIVYAFLQWAGFADLTNKREKILFVLLLVCTVVGLYYFKSRSTIIALFCYIILLLVPKKIVAHKSVMAVIIFIIIMGTLFPIIYVAIYKAGINFSIFGKSLFTGREDIWMRMFELFSENPFSIIIGLGSKVKLWEYGMETHNNYYNLIVCFGIFYYFIYFGFLLYFLNIAVKKIQEPHTRRLISGFVATALIAGYFEITTFSPFFFLCAYSGLAFTFQFSQNLIENKLKKL